MKRVSITGFVRQELYAKGSKSEHLAVIIDSGVHKYFLRKAGGNPFMDPELIKLVGKKVKTTGQIKNNILYVEDVNILD